LCTGVTEEQSEREQPLHDVSCYALSALPASACTPTLTERDHPRNGSGPLPVDATRGGPDEGAHRSSARPRSSMGRRQGRAGRQYGCSFA
jgi:hypothetical protein